MAKLEYRNDIDGLRAIAVMSVIFYHIGFHHIQAGYAGVDVFFTISGFLIGGILLREKQTGNFSYRAFYARRARRILPALFAVIITSFGIGWFFSMPNELRYFGGAALSAILSVSNIWYFNVLDYFNPAATEDPLIHTWSLGIEEQFYLIFPLLLSLIWAFARKFLLPVLVLLAFVSFVVMIVTNEDQPDAAFYLIHTRAWELLVGVILACIAARDSRWQTNSVVSSYLATFGLIVLVASLIWTPQHVVWPSVWTIPPIFGTALLLFFGGGKSIANKVLTFPPMILIGLISYSAYLWHQPVLAYFATMGRQPQSIWAMLLLTAVILGLAWLSWRWIETPFRKGGLNTRKVSTLLIGQAAIILLFSVAGHVTKGFPSRLPQAALEILDEKGLLSPTYEKCLPSRPESWTRDLASQTCIHGDHNFPRVALLGDSHAGTLANALGEALQSSGLSIQEFTLSGCTSIPNVQSNAQKRALACSDYAHRVRDFIAKSNDYDVVVIHAVWEYYFVNKEVVAPNGHFHKNEQFLFPISGQPDMSDEQRQIAIVQELSQLISDLKQAGKHVVLVQPTPSPWFDIPRFAARSLWNSGKEIDELGYPVSNFKDLIDPTNDMLIKAASGKATLVNPMEQLCANDGECLVIKDGRPLYADHNHLSVYGVSEIIPGLVRAIVDQKSAQAN
ncbi:hypothetical protein BFP76_12510 [Amylibacter kogurei]|uniref:Acyltransferase n=1 Tax=Paramylibacter kogurei TaxID=1889778 RepID=A0A2G5K8F9_9RHOB|nr:acyltransferase family protein [Amylibacter kogurei]PIB25821.1 hypothetical protein BFP76_12510 [Amylibacter kogurei]